jgi:hypothetical protein
MNIAFDPNEWSAAMAGDAAQEACAHPEWQALRARMSAAVETWNMLEAARRNRTACAAGSFSRRAAGSLGRIGYPCAAINQTGSVNRKPGGAMLLDVADMNGTGGRGQ